MGMFFCNAIIHHWVTLMSVNLHSLLLHFILNTHAWLRGNVSGFHRIFFQLRQGEQWTDFHPRSHVYMSDNACTWQCTREIEDTLVELTYRTPVIKKHLHNLPPTHWLRQRVFIGQIHVPRRGWQRGQMGLFKHWAMKQMLTFPYSHAGHILSKEHNV